MRQRKGDLLHVLRVVKVAAWSTQPVPSLKSHVRLRSQRARVAVTDQHVSQARAKAPALIGHAVRAARVVQLAVKAPASIGRATRVGQTVPLVLQAQVPQVLVDRSQRRQAVVVPVAMVLPAVPRAALAEEMPPAGAVGPLTINCRWAPISPLPEGEDRVEAKPRLAGEGALVVPFSLFVQVMRKKNGSGRRSRYT